MGPPLKLSSPPIYPLHDSFLPFPSLRSTLSVTLHAPALHLQILSMHCDIKPLEGEKRELQLRLTFEDKMDRQLTSELKEGGWVFVTVGGATVW